MTSRSLALAATAGLAITSAVWAANIVWTGGSAGTYQDPMNWLGGAVPGLNDTSVFNTSPGVGLDFNADVVQARFLQSQGDIILNLNGHLLDLRRSGSQSPSWTSGSNVMGEGQVDIVGGSVICNWAELADSIGESSSIIMNGADVSFESRDSTRVGVFGPGAFTIGQGAGMIVGNDLVLGEQPQGNGTITLRDPGTTLQVIDQIQVGSIGQGTLSVNDDTTVTCDDLFVASFNFSSGNAFVRGANSIVDASTAVGVGFAGTGTLTVSDGGRVDCFQLRVGFNPGSIGQLEVKNAGSSLNVDADAAVGSSGDGELIVRSGGSVSAGTLAIGTGATTASVILENAASSLTVAGETTIGTIGNGVLDISGFATANTGAMTVGASGLLALSGGNVVCPTLTVEGFGIGTRGALTETGIFGSGTVTSDLTNNGVIKPGSGTPGPVPTFGALTFNGALTQSNTGVIELDLTVPTFDDPTVDLVVVTGDVTLDGELRVNPVSTINPALGDRIPFLTGATTISGSFADADLPSPAQPTRRFIIVNTGTTLEFVATTFGDLDGDLTVSGTDLAMLLAAWSSSDPNADFNDDGVVDGTDLATLLAEWG